MNIIAKSAVAAALALGASGAYALGIPATNSSDLVLVIQNESTPANVYALDTGISINSVMPSSGLSANSSLSTAIAGINTSIGASSTLQAFLVANPAASDGWTVEAAQYGGATSSSAAAPSNDKLQGGGKAIFTSVGTPSNLAQTSLAAFTTFLNGVSNDLTAPGDGLGISPLQTATEASTGVSYSADAASKYGINGQLSDLASLGTGAVALYGFTGNGSTTNGTESYILGSATLSTSGLLTFAANGGTTPPPPPVPLPAAVWLFGSGLMGLVGVSRRRKATV
jgi:hypothetical protein